MGQIGERNVPATSELFLVNDGRSIADGLTMTRTTKWIDAGTAKSLSGDALIKSAERRIGRGLAPPPEIYRVENRRRVDWLKFPGWARPMDPQMFDGCCHEG